MNAEQCTQNVVKKNLGCLICKWMSEKAGCKWHRSGLHGSTARCKEGLLRGSSRYIRKGWKAGMAQSGRCGVKGGRGAKRLLVPTQILFSTISLTISAHVIIHCLWARLVHDQFLEQMDSRKPHPSPAATSYRFSPTVHLIVLLPFILLHPGGDTGGSGSRKDGRKSQRHKGKRVKEVASWVNGLLSSPLGHLPSLFCCMCCYSKTSFTVYLFTCQYLAYYQKGRVVLQHKHMHPCFQNHMIWPCTGSSKNLFCHQGINF